MNGIKGFFFIFFLLSTAVMQSGESRQKITLSTPSHSSIKPQFTFKQKLKRLAYRYNNPHWYQDSIQTGAWANMLTFSFLMIAKPVVYGLTAANLASPFAQKVTTIWGAADFSLKMSACLMAVNILDDCYYETYDGKIGRSINDLALGMLGPLIAFYMILPKKAQYAAVGLSAAEILYEKWASKKTAEKDKVKS